MLGWEFPPHVSGGLGTACAGIVQGLQQRGVEVLLVLPGRPAHAREATRPAAGVRALDVALSPYEQPHQRASGARPHSAGDAAGEPYGGDLFARVQSYRHRALALALRERFDLIHAHDWMTFPAGLALADARRKPLVAHFHSCEHDRNPLAPDARIAQVEQAALDGAQRVVCVSRYTAEVLARHYRLVQPDKLRVVHNAVDSRGAGERRAPARPRAVREPIVVFLGRVTVQKGPEYFLEAAARVVSVEPRVKFVLAGAGDRLSAMVERAARMGLARHVHFTGFLAPEGVQHLFDQADLYVMPSVSEPFGITPLEALERGVPVIISRQSGVREVLRHALVVDFWDVGELANKILAVLRRAPLRNWLAEQGSREARGLSWTARASELERIFAEVGA